MPWEHPWLVPIQTILLTIPLWCGFVWLPWSVIICWKRQWTKFRLLIGICLPCLLLVWSMGGFQSKLHRPATIQTLVFANVNAFGPRQDLLQKRLGLFGVDHLIVVEKRAEEISGMVRVADDYDKPVKRPSHHTGVFCRNNCNAWVSTQIGSETMAMSLALLKLEEDICVIGVHVPPPTPIDATGMRPYVDYIVSSIQDGRLRNDWEICNVDDRVLVVGDLNAVSGSWAHQKLKSTGLVDAQRNSGVRGATWPSDSDDFFRLPLFRIDHVLHHPGIALTVSQIQIPDSDHQGLYLEVAKP